MFVSCNELPRHASEIWTAMASGHQVAMRVLQLLLKNLQVKNPLEGDEDTATSMAVSNWPRVLLWPSPADCCTSWWPQHGPGVSSLSGEETLRNH